MGKDLSPIAWDKACLRLSKRDSPGRAAPECLCCTEWARSAGGHGQAQKFRPRCAETGHHPVVERRSSCLEARTGTIISLWNRVWTLSRMCGQNGAKWTRKRAGQSYLCILAGVPTIYYFLTCLFLLPAGSPMEVVQECAL